MPLDNPPSSADIEAALHEAAANGANGANAVTIACSFVLHAPAFDECVAYALVKNTIGGAIAFAVGAEICVKE